MATRTQCPQCQSDVLVPAVLAGQDVRCAACGSVFSSATNEIRPQPAAESEIPVTPPPRPDEQPRHISPEEHAAEELEDDDYDERRRFLRRDVVPHRGNVLLVLGILSLVGAGATMLCNLAPVIAIVLSVITHVLATRDLRRIDKGEMDPAGRSNTNAARICGLIGLIINGVVILACGAILLGWFGLMAVRGEFP